MNIDSKDQLQIKDRATLSWNDSKAEGPVIEVRRRGTCVLWVVLAGHPERFSLEHEAVTASEWGRRVWTFEGGERPQPEVQAGMVGTASIRRPDGLTADFVPGTWVYRTGIDNDLVFRPHRPLGGVAQIHPSAVVTFTPDPALKSAVDSYARRLENVRRGVVSMYPDDGRRQSLLMIIDDGAMS
jgi:hypothetical protein